MECKKSILRVVRFPSFIHRDEKFANYVIYDVKYLLYKKSHKKRLE